MAFSEEQKLKVLNPYDELGTVSKDIHKLGYPTRQNMYTWIKNRNIDKKNKNNSLNNHSYKRYPSAETKLSIIKRCFEDGEYVKFVSKETGYSRTGIYNWRRLYVSKGAVLLINNKKQLPRENLPPSKTREVNDDSFELNAKIKELELENDILKQTIEILKRSGH